VFSSNAQLVLKKRYSQKDKDSNPLEQPVDIFRRVADAVASVEEKDNREQIAQQFYDMMIRQDYMPNSPTIMNAGTSNPMLSACFVIPVGDSMEEIQAAVYNGAMIQRFGGGVGYSFSRLRSEGSFTSKTQGKASGPVSFMEQFNTMCNTIQQGGKRRGAQMAILRVDHPDIIEFIKAKVGNDQRLTNFNISVGVTYDFMEKVFRILDSPIDVKDPDHVEDLEYDLIDPKYGFARKQSVKEIWELIIQSAWASADPGLWFIDRANETREFTHIPIESVNPCGEQALEPNGSCNLGSINLGNFVIDYGVDWNRLGEIVQLCVRFLDNVIDVNVYPLQLVVNENGVPESKDPITEMSKYSRRIGLGVMGWADMLAKLCIPYDSDEAVDLADELMDHINYLAWNESANLAKERGVFGGFAESRLAHGDKYRNCSVTTVAPTGTISRIADCSSGIEPYFELNYYSEVMDHDILDDYAVPFVDYLRKGVRDRIIGQVTMDEILGWVKYDTLKNYVINKFVGGVVDKNAQWWKTLVDVFKTTNEIDWTWHIKHQAAFQKHTSNSISKTINMPNDATLEDVRGAYLEAYKSGCKGITVYRDGCKATQVLNRYEKEESETNIDGVEPTQPMVQHGWVVQDRPHVVQGYTDKVHTGHGNGYITVNQVDGKPFEMFTNMGKAGGCDSAMTEAVSRLVSTMLRAGFDPDIIVDQLSGITCCPQWDNGVLIKSVPDGMAHVLARYAPHEHDDQWNDPIEDIHNLKNMLRGQEVNGISHETSENPLKVDVYQGKNKSLHYKALCPVCHQDTMIFQEGCNLCTNPKCQYSSCG
jgi:ribonucleoside-diphosphate reductase alpha chain